MRPVVWAHGLEGSPDGYKATKLREAGFELIAPDGRGMALAERIPGIEAALDAHPDAILVGSSYGGLAAAWIAAQRPLAGVVLLAPALQHTEPPVGSLHDLHVHVDTPIIVIHGLRDEVCKIEGSRAYKALNPQVRMIVVDDGHPLADSLDIIEHAIRDLA